MVLLIIEMKKEEVMLGDELDGVQHSKTMGSANHRGVKLEDSNETTAEPSKRSYNLPGIAEVDKAGEALKSSIMEPRAAVTDPLPEELQQAGEDNNDESKYVLTPSFMEQHSTTIKYEVISWKILLANQMEYICVFYKVNA